MLSKRRQYFGNVSELFSKSFYYLDNILMTYISSDAVIRVFSFSLVTWLYTHTDMFFFFFRHDLFLSCQAHVLVFSSLITSQIFFQLFFQYIYIYSHCTVVKGVNKLQEKWSSQTFHKPFNTSFLLLGKIS